MHFCSFSFLLEPLHCMAVCSADSESQAENEHFEGLLFHSQPYGVQTVPLMLLFSPREATHAQNAGFVDKFLTQSLYLIAFHHCWQFVCCPLLLPVVRIYLVLACYLSKLWLWHWCCLYLLVPVGQKGFLSILISCMVLQWAAIQSAAGFQATFTQQWFP